MTLRWLICFSLTAAAFGASVTGSVRLTGTRQRDRSGVVVWLKSNGAAPATPPGAKVVMEQRNKRFVPHVLAVRVGGEVEFPNYDPIFHNAFSSFAGQTFDLGLYPPGKTRIVVFKRPGIVRVFCNIHPTMSAVIAVLEQPWFAVSNAAGAFTIADVPAGEYEMHVFHERATEGTLSEMVRRVTVPAGGLDLPPLVISETGYVETPHKNKYGLDYPPPPDERGVYGGTKK